ncbi:MAG: CehA/McbA family metallohydrolase, partial [Myxococcaceae bacterium]
FSSLGCTVDPSPWFAYQGSDVTYAVRSQRLDSLKTPTPANALLLIAGVAASVADGQDSAGFLSWLDAQTVRRPGAFALQAGAQGLYLRDFFVGRDLAELTSTFNTLDGLSAARLNVTVKDVLGGAAAEAGVALFAVSSGRLLTVMRTDAEGKAHVDIPTGNYRVQAWREGHALPAMTDVSLPSVGVVEQALSLGATRKLTVNVVDAAGAAMPGKVVLLCPSGRCAIQQDQLRAFGGAEVLAPNIAAVAFVPPSGELELQVPPAAYQVVVSRGPEYSIFPRTWPASGQPVDLTLAEVTVNATLAHVVDTSGWTSADLHVHGVASPDSSVSSELRVLNFAAEGVDVLVSTDHDSVTDYAPTIKALGAEGFIASMIGDEVTSFDFGHFNAFPLTRAEAPGGGAFDWAGGDGPTLRLSQIFGGLREKYPGALLQLNHPRGVLGVFNALQVDTATGASHADPARFRMEADPAATSANTRLFSDDFDLFEVHNGLMPSYSYLNDWMTFLSRGAVKTATAVSDTHALTSLTGGYGRTFVKTAPYEQGGFSAALKARRAVGTNGPFMTATAQALDGSSNPVGAVVSVGDTLSVAAGTKVRITVDVQAPEWMTFDVLELYTHAPGREALNGAENSEWPPSRVLATQTFNTATLPVETVPGPGTFHRIHLTHAFEVTPTADTWYVAMLRSTTAANTLFPLAYDGVLCQNNNCRVSTARPAAFTNAV